MAQDQKPKGIRESGVPFEAAQLAASMKVRKVGNSLGVILPRDILNALGVDEGDSIDIVQTEDGRIELAIVDREADDLMSMAEEIMAENRAVLRALAK